MKSESKLEDDRRMGQGLEMEALASLHEFRYTVMMITEYVLNDGLHSANMLILDRLKNASPKLTQ